MSKKLVRIVFLKLKSIYVYKIALFVIISCSLLIIIACDNDSDLHTSIESEKHEEGDLQKQELNKAKEENDLNEKENTDSEQTKVEKELLKQAYEGKMDGVEFGIGDNGNDIVEKWGEPVREGYFLGGLYMSYEDIVFLTDGCMDENKMYEYGNIVAICNVGDNKVFEVKNGMTLEEIKEVLGEPDYIYEYKSGDEEDELYGDSWLAIYNTGDYNVIFEFENDKCPINAIHLR